VHRPTDQTDDCSALRPTDTQEHSIHSSDVLEDSGAAVRHAGSTRNWAVMQQDERIKLIIARLTDRRTATAVAQVPELTAPNNANASCSSSPHRRNVVCAERLRTRERDDELRNCMATMNAAVLRYAIQYGASATVKEVKAITKRLKSEMIQNGAERLKNEVHHSRVHGNATER